MNNGICGHKHYDQPLRLYAWMCMSEHVTLYSSCTLVLYVCISHQPAGLEMPAHALPDFHYVVQCQRKFTKNVYM